MFFLTYENWYEIVFDISFSKTPHKKRTLRTSHFKKHKKTVFSFFFIIFFSSFLYYAQKLKIKTKVEIENWKTLIFQMPYKMPPTSHIYISNLSDLHFSQSKKLTCFKSFVVSVDLSLTKSTPDHFLDLTLYFLYNHPNCCSLCTNLHHNAFSFVQV